MSATQNNNRPRSPIEIRPMLPDAPAWFNEARARSNQRPTFASSPPPLSIAWSWMREAKLRLKSSSPQAILIAALLMALPVTFCVGFCTRGSVAPAPRETAGRGHVRIGHVRLAGVRNAEAKPQVIAAQIAAQPTAPAPMGGMRQDDQASAVVALEAQTQRQEQAAPIRESEHMAKAISRHNKLVAASADPELRNEGPPASGFGLTPPGVPTLVANVRLREKSWFETAADEVRCESGLCARPPTQPTDRKLNTALVWSTSPEAAAEEARRDGKLVFLIHVSGNFAQPGFT
jgi:hypothetical protein